MKGRSACLARAPSPSTRIGGLAWCCQVRRRRQDREQCQEQENRLSKGERVEEKKDCDAREAQRVTRRSDKSQGKDFAPTRVSTTYTAQKKVPRLVNGVREIEREGDTGIGDKVQEEGKERREEC